MRGRTKRPLTCAGPLLLSLGLGVVARPVRGQAADTASAPVTSVPLVATATGVRERVQLGIDAVVIDVDSVLRVMPAATLADVLESRVPGLVVLHGSGVTGDPSFLRLRGVSSVTQRNDPLILFNGVRLSASRLPDAPVNLAGIGGSAVPAPAPSPLDQIDPHAVDRVEILRGPSVTALYGSDGAAGVILITTKRGHSGANRWDLSLRGGRASLGDDYPAGYFRFGRDMTNPNGQSCTFSDPYCVVDSLKHFQALNNPQYTLFGHGTDAAVSLTASGGGDVTYAVTGSATNTTGILHLPALEAAYFQRQHDFAAPDWMRDPDQYTTWRGTGTVTAPLGHGATAALTSMLFDGTQRRSSLELSIAPLLGAYLDPTAASQNGFVPTYMQRVTSNALTSATALSVQWPVASWLPLSGTFGLDHVRRRDKMVVPQNYEPAPDTFGVIQTGDGTAMTKTGALSTVLPGFARLSTALGVSVVSESDALSQTDQISTTPPSGSERRVTPSPRTTFGGFVEPRLALTPRLFVTPGVRWDESHVAGIPSRVTSYPQVTASWIASDESRFPLRSLLPLLRLRVAYGYAGGEAGPGDPPAIMGVAPLTTSQMALAGTGDLLRPERVHEVEGGFDAEFWRHRVALAVTTYRKTNQDATLLALSTGGPGVNVLQGSAAVRNSGTEVGLTATLLDGPQFGWTVAAAFGRNDNLVTAVTPGSIQDLATDQFGTRVVAGYPLFGRWVLPIVSYSDVNHDGIVTSNEVQVGSVPIFTGPEFPRTTIGLNSAVTLLGGRLSAHTTVEYESDISQFNAALITPSATGPTLLEGLATGPRASLALQAAAVALPQTPYGAIQNVHALRWRALSVNYAVPSGVTRRLHVPGAALAVQGENLVLHTNYRGPDPTIGAFAFGNSAADMGQVPLPRSWSVRVKLGN